MEKTFCDRDGCGKEIGAPTQDNEYRFTVQYQSSNDYGAFLIKHHFCSKECLIDWVQKV